MNSAKGREIYGESNVWSTAQRKKESWGLDVGFEETLDHFAMVDSVGWCSHVLRRALCVYVESQRNMGWWGWGVGRKRHGVSLS